MYKLFVIICALAFSAKSMAAGEALISSISAWGPVGNSHPNIVQIQLEGGLVKSAFNNASGTCDATNAGIRMDGGQHLISLAYAAFISKQPIGVWLNPSDKYFDNSRCVITGIWLVK